DNGEKEIVPAGVFYYTIDDPMINKEELKGGIEEIDEQRLKKLGMRGIVNSDIRVLKNIDKMLVGTDGTFNSKYSSDIIKASVDASGNLKASGDVINPENFEALRNKAREIMADKTEQMYDGNIKANPYKYKGKTPCDYCKFRSICKFDVKLEGNNYKRLTEKSMEDIKDNEVDN
ncbi:MAG: PD-(D/E)XK nuclease family protein, partial [Lachnospiraceae bacterium]|nr:PD-(D/E)XK nuclease family protein [Lachnospiraceae bacterium]